MGASKRPKMDRLRKWLVPERKSGRVKNTKTGRSAKNDWFTNLSARSKRLKQDGLNKRMRSKWKSGLVKNIKNGRSLTVNDLEIKNRTVQDVQTGRCFRMKGNGLGRLLVVLVKSDDFISLANERAGSKFYIFFKSVDWT